MAWTCHIRKQRNRMKQQTKGTQQSTLSPSVIVGCVRSTLTVWTGWLRNTNSACHLTSKYLFKWHHCWWRRVFQYDNISGMYTDFMLCRETREAIYLPMWNNVELIWSSYRRHFKYFVCTVMWNQLQHNGVKEDGESSEASWDKWRGAVRVKI